MPTIYRTTDVRTTAVQRFPTGIISKYGQKPLLDMQFGSNEGIYGPPEGKLTLVSGGQGVGKSRWAVEVSKSCCMAGYRVLFITNELEPDQFVPEKLGNYRNDNFYVARLRKLSEIVNAIITCQAKWVVIDSAQTIKEFAGGRGGEEIVEGYNGQKGLRKAAEMVGSHICLLSQQTTSGSTKGGTELPHYVDIEAFMNRDKDVGVNFYLKFGKNRYGKSDTRTLWQHNEHGVTLLSEAVGETNLTNYWSKEQVVARDAEVEAAVPQRRRWWQKLFGILF